MNTKYLEIIKAPVVTEKSAIAKESNVYTFMFCQRQTKQK